MTPTSSTPLFDLIIIGGGPAGSAAAVYAARKQLKTLMILKEWGGQSVVSDDVQNWIGTPHISGPKLAESLKAHVMEYKGDILTISENESVTNITGTDGNFTVTTEKNIFNGKTVLIATGSSRKKLEVPGAGEFENKGITYCASCDGPLFGGMDVVVVGGGNAGFESAAQLLAYCKSVTLLSRSEPRADAITVEKLKQKEHFNLIVNAIPKSIQGSVFVESITYTKTDTNEDVTLPVGAVFVEIGPIPATGFAKDIVDTTPIGTIKIDPRTQKTSTEGIWAAGDCTDVLYHQNNIAAGDAVRALEDIYLHIHA
jgi:alkyl hydroperoxide reductase subunit F